MKLHIFSILCCCILTTSACNAPISRNKMVEIIVEMHEVDQKILDFPMMMHFSDSTFVYQAIFQQYGYSQKDFDKSLSFHIKKPEKFKKSFSAYRDQLVKRKNFLQKAIDDESKREEFLKNLKDYFTLPKLPVFPFSPYIDSVHSWSIDTLTWWSQDTTHYQHAIIPLLPDSLWTHP